MIWPFKHATVKTLREREREREKKVKLLNLSVDLPSDNIALPKGQCTQEVGVFGVNGLAGGQPVWLWWCEFPSAESSRFFVLF